MSYMHSWKWSVCKGTFAHPFAALIPTGEALVRSYLKPFGIMPIYYIYDIYLQWLLIIMFSECFILEKHMSHVTLFISKWH